MRIFTDPKPYKRVNQAMRLRTGESCCIMLSITAANVAMQRCTQLNILLLHMQHLEWLSDGSAMA